MNSPLPQSIVQNRRLGDWFSFTSRGVLVLKTGKVEIGQGILTALRQIAAEELDLPLSSINVVSGDTSICPDEGPTVASLSIMTSGPAIRMAASELRGLLFAAAAERLSIDVGRLDALDGVFRIEQLATSETYWTVASSVDMERSITGAFPSKAAADYRIVGTNAISGEFRRRIAGEAYIHDLATEGMLHGRVLRQPALGARLVAVDLARAQSMPGVVRVVRDGNFLGIVTDTEAALFLAMDRLERMVEWTIEQDDRSSRTPLEHLKSALAAPTTVLDNILSQQPNWQFTATFTKPLLNHGSIGPSCAIAAFEGEQLTLWTHSQNVFALRAQIARLLDLDESRITVRHLPGAGCYGHNGADDAAFDAVLLARSVAGRAVRVQWSRRDELRSEPLGTPMSVNISAALNREGRIAAWALTTRSGTHVQRPGWNGEANFLGATSLGTPWPLGVAMDVPLEEGGGGGSKNSVAGYDFPQRVAYEFVSDLPFRVSSMRSLGAFANVLAIEGAMDELARLADCDPIEFRYRHLSPGRGRSVIEHVVELSGWSHALPEGQGKGLGYAQFENESSYCAVVAHVLVEEDVRLLNMWAVVDAGLAINPGGIVAQIEGGIVQAASWTLKEAVPTEGPRITSESWKDYPILRFDEIPNITVKVLSDPGDVSTGVGEVAMGPTSGAISNAVARALGVRVYDLPITRDRIIAAIMTA